MSLEQATLLNIFYIAIGMAAIIWLCIMPLLRSIREINRYPKLGVAGTFFLCLMFLCLFVNVTVDNVYVARLGTRIGLTFAAIALALLLPAAWPKKSRQ